MQRQITKLEAGLQGCKEQQFADRMWRKDQSLLQCILWGEIMSLRRLWGGLGMSAQTVYKQKLFYPPDALDHHFHTTHKQPSTKRDEEGGKLLFIQLQLTTKT